MIAGCLGGSYKDRVWRGILELPRRRKSFIEDIFGGSLFDEIDRLFEKFGEEPLSSGYSIRVTQTPEGTKVYAKVSEDTDVNELRRRLQQEYPGAQIEIEGGKPLIREISTRTLEEEEKEKKDRKGVWFKPE